MGDINFKVISAAENSNKFQKTRFFWKEKSVEDVVTLGPMARAKLVSLKGQIGVWVLFSFFPLL